MMSYLRSTTTVAVSSILVACAMFMFTGSAHAALGQLDFESGSIPLTPTQAGWASNWWADSSSTAFKDISGNSGSGIELRFKYQGSDLGNSGQDINNANLQTSPLIDVHRDAVRSDTGLELELQGLVANTAYNLRFHHFRDSANPVYNFDIYKDDDTVAANFLYNTGNFGDTTNFSSDFVHTSDSNGKMWLETKPGAEGQSPNWSGFEVLSVVPEPSSFLLVACGLISLMSYAGRRRK